jgi:uncharacterized repeat protein (TIGR01451 family)
MKKRMVAMILILLGTLYPFRVALANDLFYVGDIFIYYMNIRVEADDEAVVNVVYLLANRGSAEEEVDLKFAQSPVSLQVEGEELSNPVVFRSGESKYVYLTYNLDITGDTTKMLCLDPTLLFNGKPNNQPTQALLIEILLPEGVSALAWSNQEPDEEYFLGSRKFYSWSGAGIYPTTLCLKWSTLQVELSVEKKASPQEITAPDQVINLEITVQNKGDAVVNNISLIDQYIVSEFEAVEPSEEFGEQETMLFWIKNIDSLGPGETKTLAYSVKYTGLSPDSYEFDLSPCLVTVDGYLVSVSNKVRMSQSGSEVPWVMTLAATEVTTDSATLNMDYNAGSFVQIEVRFAYRRPDDSTWSFTDWVSKSGDGPHAESIAGLDSDTIYGFRAQLKYNDAVHESITSEFNTEGPGSAGLCFIATAAYGTPITEEIEVLREFRDKYLLTNSVGQALVDVYYEVSPPIAELINKHPGLKPIVRAGLLPTVAIAAVTVNTSPAEKMAIIELLVLVSVAMPIWLTRRRKRGSQYT